MSKTDLPTVEEAGAPVRGLSFVKSQLPRLKSAGILLPFVILFVFLTFATPAFFQQTNLQNILEQQAAILIMGAAGTLVLISGGIDLSVGATYALTGVIYAQLGQHNGVAVSLALALGAGLVIGLANGLITTIGRINSLIATLSMSFIVTGIASKISEGNLIVLTSKPEFGRLAQTTILGVHSSIWLAVAALVVMGVLLSRSTFGRYLYAAGGNPEAARLAGIRVTWVRVAAFATSGVAAALAGCIDVSRFLTAQSATGDTLAFTVLAGIVVGGTSILGGEGSIWRSIVGVLFIALVGNGFDLLGIDPLYQQVTLGVIILLAVGLDVFARVSRRS